MIAEIFRRIGVTNRWFVEIGVSPLECNTLLLLTRGWRGLWLDAATHDLGCVAHHLNDGRLRFIPGAMNRENINEVLRPVTPDAAEIDLFSLDIDGNDYWVWESLEVLRPRVVIIEYNALFPPPVSVAVPYNPRQTRNGTNHFGASLEALSRLGRRKGYSLAACNTSGVNAFFVRSELVSDLFRDPFTAANHYEPPRYFIQMSAGPPPGYGPTIEID